MRMTERVTTVRTLALRPARNTSLNNATGPSGPALSYFLALAIASGASVAVVLELVPKSLRFAKAAAFPFDTCYWRYVDAWESAPRILRLGKQRPLGACTEPLDGVPVMMARREEAPTRA